MRRGKSLFRPNPKMQVAAIIAASLTAAAAARAARGDGEKLKIETTLHFLASIAREIGGDEVQVDALARATEDPHEVTPTPQKMVSLRDADAFIESGFQLEIWDDNCIEGARNPKIQKQANGFCKAADGVAMLEVAAAAVGRAGGDIHPAGNPHVWFEPFVGHIYARNIEKCLARIAEGKSETWAKNRKAFDKKLDEAVFGKELVEIMGGPLLEKLAHQGKLDDFLAGHKAPRPKGSPEGTAPVGSLSDLLGGLMKKARPLKGAKLVTYHRSWPYFAQTYGCELVGEMEPKPGIPPDAAHLEELEKRCKEKGVKVVLVMSYEPKKRAEDFAEKIGGKVALCPSDVDAEGAKDWFDFQEKLVDAVVAALPAEKK